MSDRFEQQTTEPIMVEPTSPPSPSLEDQLAEEMKKVKKHYDERMIGQVTWAAIIIFLTILLFLPNEQFWVVSFGLGFLLLCAALFQLARGIRRGIIVFFTSLIFFVYSADSIGYYKENMVYLGVGFLLVGIALLVHGLFFRGHQPFLQNDSKKENNLP